MFNIFKKKDDQAPQYTGEQRDQYMDGFREGFPLKGQPVNPEHETEAYQRGLNYGKKAFRRAGSPQINYEESGE